MNTRLTRFVTILATVILALPLQALASGSVSEFTTSPRQPNGQLISDITPITQDIYPVRFTYINGRPVTGERSVLWLKPGEYRIQGTVVANPMQRSVPGGSRLRPRSQSRQMEPLELVVEEGQNYYIGGLHLHAEEGSRRQNWRLVLWKVEDRDGETRFPLREQDEEGDEGDDESISL
jgi:hypothetical protein